MGRLLLSLNLKEFVKTPGSSARVLYPGLPKGVYSAPSTLGPPNTLGVPPNTLGHFRKICVFSLCFVGVRRIHSKFHRIHSFLRDASPNTLECKRNVFSDRIHSNLAGYTRISPDTLESRRIHAVSPLAEYTRIQKITKTYGLEPTNLV